MLALNQPFGGFVYRRRYYVYEIARGKFKTRRRAWQNSKSSILQMKKGRWSEACMITIDGGAKSGVGQ